MMKRALVHADFGSLRKSRRTIMRKTIVAAAALAAVLSLGASADRAAAMTAATPTELGLATADSGVVEKAALVCNRWGCRRVWWGHRAWWGPRRRVYAFAGPSWGWGWRRPGWGWRGPGWGWRGW
jgi:hypothetical protein